MDMRYEAGSINISHGGFPLHEVMPQQSYDWLSYSASATATSVKAPAAPPSFLLLLSFFYFSCHSAARFPVPSGRRQKIRLPPVGLQWIFAQVSAKRDNTRTHTRTHTHTSYIHAYLALYIAAWASPVATLDFGMRFA